MKEMRKMEELISVIVPVYNVEKYLRRCVESILKQTYKKIEIVLVDDGSTDQSGEICNEYVKKDRRIHVIHKKNGGLSDARNAGLTVAQGEYVAFIDSDDFIHEDYVLRLYEILQEKHADIAVCHFEKGRKNEFTKTRSRKKEVQCFCAEQMLKAWHGKYKHIETMAWNKLYKRELFTENNIQYPVGYYNEDVQTTHLLVDKSQCICLTDERLYYYFQRKESITGTLSQKKVEDNIFSQRKRQNFFKQKGYAEAYERLSIKLQKYFMLTFCLLREQESGKLKKELIEQFKGGYEIVCAYKSTSMKDRILFALFNKYYKVFEKIFNLNYS